MRRRPCAGCATKPLIGDGSRAVCVPPGVDLAPIDATFVDAFFECTNAAIGGEEASPECQEVEGQFFTATGCGLGSPCVEAVSGRDAREAPCAAVTDLTQCESTRIAAPCPDWPAPEPLAAKNPAPIMAAPAAPGSAPAAAAPEAVA